MRVDKGLKPMAVVVVGILLLCVLDTFVKSLMQHNSTAAVVLMRYASGALWSILLFLMLRGETPGSRSLRSNLLRSFVVVGTAFTFFYALGTLPFAETIAITFTAPIFIAILGRVILKERVGGHVVLAVLLGSAGVAVILGARLSPGGVGLHNVAGVASALASAVFYALATVLLRKQTARDPIVTIVLLQNVFAALIALPVAAVSVSMPTRADLLLMLGAGFFGTLGHLAMAWGYKRAEAARLGALEYTGFVWASLLGWAFFNETPSTVVFLGAALIMAGAAAAGWGARKFGGVVVEEA